MDEIRISLTVNGKTHHVTVDKATTLLEVIRDRLYLTGTKEGCGYGKCGTCTVVMNGEAVRSCIVKAVKADGADITTIEGISDGDRLHPIQVAFLEAYAVQCGFCIPGIIMSLYALFNKKKDAPPDEIKELLNRHFCRCTGYENISRAAMLAQQKLIH
ncbi:MAG: (2Fe-2S)-binding protein [Vulcanimicrobiota bacterium]